MALGPAFKFLTMKRIKMFYACAAMALLVSCNEGFLEVKPASSLLVPNTLSDLQALLDNIAVMNRTPAMSTVSADEFKLMDGGMAKLKNAYERGAYLWSRDPYEGALIGDWITPYEQVFYANVVLDALGGIDRASSPQVHDQLKGSALFFRAYALHGLAQIFAKPYDPLTAAGEPGLPAPVVSDVNNRPGRGSLRSSRPRPACWAP
ncbi:MAG: hypothetical protein EOP02_03005 [Proteobacteria bacterium]|nr:MAG: hypothetical protein EOP02_03005 [Pseudomonadota bacterium]